ncbi:hypothetical protein S245_020200, partial [Arachis hypogaea]
MTPSLVLTLLRNTQSPPISRSYIFPRSTLTQLPIPSQTHTLAPYPTSASDLPR